MSKPPVSDLSRRLRTHGEALLSDAECVALLLGGDRGGVAPLMRACRVLRKAGGMGGLRSRIAAGEYLGLGLREREFDRLAAATGLARRAAEARLLRGRQLRSSADVARLVREATAGEDRESFRAVDLDAQHRVRRVRVVSVGGLRAAPVHPREVFGPALGQRASALVVAHNHPSGDPLPSDDDVMVTERLRRVGELCGIELLDHVVVGCDEYYSFAEERVLPMASHGLGAEKVGADGRSG